MPADRYTQKTFVHAVLAGGGGAALDAAMSKTIFPTARLLLRSWKPSSTPAAENGSSRKMTAFTVAPVAAGASTSEARYSRSAVLTLVRNRCSFFLPEREGEESGVRGEGERGRETVRDTRRGMARLLYTCMCCANASMCVTVCVHVHGAGGAPRQAQVLFAGSGGSLCALDTIMSVDRIGFPSIPVHSTGMHSCHTFLSILLTACIPRVCM